MVRRLSFRATPIAWILLAIAVLHTVGIGWGLPGSDGWDNDGIAPRDFLPGLAKTFTPGQFYTYPPVHLALLAVVTLPIVLVGCLRAPSHALVDLVTEMIEPGYMTSIAYVARFVSMLMSLGIVLFAARLAEEMRAEAIGLVPEPSSRRLERWLNGDFADPRVRRAGWFVAAFVGLEATLGYYAHTTNLDVPYLFWGLAALLAFARAIARDEPRRFRRALVLAVLAVSTKDQAYALFGLSLPAVFLLAGPTRARIRELGIALALGIALFLVTDAVVFNPSGFAARVRFLTGSASQDYVEYTRDWSGRLGVLRDAARTFDLQLPKLAAPFVLLGTALTVRRKRPIAALPLLVTISFTVLFNWASLRTNARFLMPQGVMLGIYAGLGAEALAFAASRPMRVAARAAVAGVLALALHRAVAVDVNLLRDPRYEAEAWLREHVKPGETIETYGLNVYLPRFPEGAKVIRVGPEPIAKRNRLPDVREVQDAYENAAHRDARFIVLPVGWGWRYLIPSQRDLPPGRVLPPTQERTASEGAAKYFERLSFSQDAFALAHIAEYPESSWFPVVDIHGDTGRPVWIYERKHGN